MAALRRLILPFGKSTGTRIDLDGVNGWILVYNAANELILSLSPTAGTDASGNSFVAGYAAYDPGQSYALMNSGTFEITSDASPDIYTTIQQGLIQFTEDDFVSRAFQMNFDSDAGLNLRCLSTTRRAVWHGPNGFWYAGTGDGYTREDWTDVAFAANWQHWTERTQYKLMPDGTVRLKGSAQYTAGVPAGGTDIFTLPAGYRPPQQRLYVIPHWASATHSRILILPTGVVEIYDAPNEFPAFDIISFSTI